MNPRLTLDEFVAINRELVKRAGRDFVETMASEPLDWPLYMQVEFPRALAACVAAGKVRA